MQHPLIVTLSIIAVVSLSVKMRKLTLPAGITGGIIAAAIFAGAGITGLAMLGVFFLLGTAATSWGRREKRRLGVAEHHSGRTTGQVLANGGVAALAGLLAYIYTSYREPLILTMAAALSSATADTLSSELGTLYGRSFYNILTLKVDSRGENGVVSLEGTLIGIAGSAIIALVHALAFCFGHYFIIIIIAGTVGNIIDSILGATLERGGYIRNNVVNLLNTIVAALTALMISMF